MRRLWLCALPIAVLLGSATPPAALGYDFAGLVAARACDGQETPACTVLQSRQEALAEADRQRLLAEAEARARAEAAAVDAGLKLVISIPQQRLYMFRGDELLATSRVSTGKRGHPTPTGTFAILQKQVAHRSNLYSNAPMPYMQRLTGDGVALHAGMVRGYPASHGCIRLPFAFARMLYRLTSWTTRVTITHAQPRSVDQAWSLAPRHGADRQLALETAGSIG